MVSAAAIASPSLSCWSRVEQLTLTVLQHAYLLFYRVPGDEPVDVHFAVLADSVNPGDGLGLYSGIPPGVEQAASARPDADSGLTTLGRVAGNCQQPTVLWRHERSAR